MIAAKITSIALAAIFSTASLAMPSSNGETFIQARQEIDTSNWVSVDFQGKTLKYNPAALNTSVQVHTTSSGDVFSPAVITKDCCGDSSFSGTDAPWPSEGDCAVIRDWAYTLNAYWSIWTNTPDYHGVVVYNTCVFGAGTRNTYDTYIGSSDMGDIVRDSITRLANNGLVGAAGNMGST
ncbi:hypothetical protein J7T55_005654 [Diaporthe amygdali]|uniref:uncharacterized protein n=1 Tax=Phomopsis amygdali TaxID=1214568 RepID=UPI0022FE42A9|nr:uncharacterized protein J7T55_005654 [Diaporthe amygdali]KAJ0124316.1 hypothetical protein J7T55_005654 [Diaporthe amygdali]